jgi:hypothetical protein
MKRISFIEDTEVIKKILKHLGLWDIKARHAPKATATPPDFHITHNTFIPGGGVVGLMPLGGRWFVPMEALFPVQRWKPLMSIPGEVR